MFYCLAKDVWIIFYQELIKTIDVAHLVYNVDIKKSEWFSSKIYAFLAHIRWMSKVCGVYQIIGP